MDGARALNPTPGLPGCEHCGTPPGALPPVTTALFPGGLVRCNHCGLRWTHVHGAARPVRSCRDCGLAFAAEDPTDPARCGDCRDERLPDDLPRRQVAEAGEHELRQALASRLRPVRLPARSDYPSRVARTMAAAIPGAPPHARVVLFDDPVVRTLALPSGLILVSTGCLAELQDEAELAFALAHELAHVAAGDAELGLVRIGLRTLAAAESAEGGATWASAAADLVKLGYGADAEVAADGAAVVALVRQGYDPGAPRTYLKRLESRIEAGDPAVAELACAHPPPDERLYALDDLLRARFPDAGPGRTNRELFRRAAGHRVLSSGLEDAPEALAGDEDESGAPWSRGPLVWTALGIVLLATLVLVLGFVLTR